MPTNKPEDGSVLIQWAREARNLPRLNVDEVNELAIRAKAGDTASRERLLIAHANLMLNFSSQLGRNRTERLVREDAQQEVVVLFLEALKNFDPNKGKFSGYLRKVLLRMVSPGYREANKPLMTHSPEVIDRLEVHEDGSFLNLSLQEALKLLTDEEREIAEAISYGATLPEIALMLGCKTTTAGNRAAAVKERLRELLTESHETAQDDPGTMQAG